MANMVIPANSRINIFVDLIFIESRQVGCVPVLVRRHNTQWAIEFIISNVAMPETTLVVPPPFATGTGISTCNEYVPGWLKSKKRLR